MFQTEPITAGSQTDLTHEMARRLEVALRTHLEQAQQLLAAASWRPK